VFLGALVAIYFLDKGVNGEIERPYEG